MSLITQICTSHKYIATWDGNTAY